MFYRHIVYALALGSIAFLGSANMPLAQSAAKAPATVPATVPAPAPAPAAPQNKGAGAKLIAGGWTLACKPDATGKDLRCEVSHSVAVAKTRQTILSVFVSPIGQVGNRDTFVLRFQLPHGLSLPAGIKLQIDGREAPAPMIRTSSQAGVFANTPLTDALLMSLRKGATMAVSFSAMNGDNLSVPVSLKGFSAVFAKSK